MAGIFTQFKDYSYNVACEVVMRNIDIFNEKSRGAIVLDGSKFVGKEFEEVNFKLMSDAVRTRNIHGTGDVTSKHMEELLRNRIKVAAALGPIVIPTELFSWMQRDPKTAAANWGVQLAGLMMENLIDTAMLGLIACTASHSDCIYDARSDTPNTLNYVALNNTAYKFGDKASSIKAWLMHSASHLAIANAASTNTERLFQFASVNMMQDIQGTLFIVSDLPSLIANDGSPFYRVLGLSESAVKVSAQNDFRQNIETSNGKENIQDTMQAQWTNTLAVKGYKGLPSLGECPNDAAIASSANWERVSTDVKSTAGVVLLTR